jgi:hypothetical protein
MLVLGALALGAAAVLAMTLRPHGLAGTAQAQGGAALVLDMNADNGNGPCDPIDGSTSVGKGAEFKVAVCLRGATEAPSAFDLYVGNDESLDQCVPVDCPDTDTSCLDTNPDANAGATTWGTSLGTRWDCSGVGHALPTCHSASGKVYLGCFSTQTPTLPFGPEVAAPLAVVTFRAIAEGTDTFSLDSGSDAAALDSSIVDCSNPTVCPGGSVTIAGVAAPTATVASSPVPSTTPATGPAATAQPTAAAGEGGGSSGPNAGVIGAIVVGAVVVVGGGGWFAWRRLRAG